MKYYNSAGKPIPRDVAIAGLITGSPLTVEVLRKSIKIERVDGEYEAGCQEHNSKCKMRTPLRALGWVEDHLRQYH